MYTRPSLTFSSINPRNSGVATLLFCTIRHLFVVILDLFSWTMYHLLVLWKLLSTLQRVKRVRRRKKGEKRGRPPGESTLAWRWALLRELGQKRQIPYAELVTWYDDVSKRSEADLRQDIEALQDVGVPIEMREIEGVVMVSFPPLDIKQLWDGPGIGERLDSNLASKRLLAEYVVDFWQQKHNEMHEVILGAGTMVWEISKELLGRFTRAKPGAQFAQIHTANLLVLREFILHNIDGHILGLSVMAGRLVRSAGHIETDQCGRCPKADECAGDHNELRRSG